MNMVPQNLNADATAEIADICSEDLFGDTSTVTILHREMIYTLRITRQGKLLLTK